MPSTHAAQIHALTSEYATVEDIQVGPGEVWGEDGEVAHRGVVVVMTGTYQMSSHSVGVGDGDGERVSDTYWTMDAEMARRFAELLWAAAAGEGDGCL